MKSVIFLDIDGTLIKHKGSLDTQMQDPELLPSVKEKLLEWEKLDYQIILTTGRKECTRKQTEKQLCDLGIYYDQLIMGLGRGTRILINDTKPNSSKPTAVSFSPQRNEGIGNIQLDNE